MRDKDRIDKFCEELKEVWKEYYPDLRFGQLITNFFTYTESANKVNIFYVDETEMTKYLEEYIKRSPLYIEPIEFQLGDIVERKDGKIGFISHVCHCEKCKERGFFESTIMYLDGEEDYISNYSVKNVPKKFKRIGIQTF